MGLFGRGKKSRKAKRESRKTPAVTEGDEVAVSTDPWEQDFERVQFVNQIDEEATDPYTGEPIFELLAEGKIILRCRTCKALYAHDSLATLGMRCARDGCGISAEDENSPDVGSTAA